MYSRNQDGTIVEEKTNMMVGQLYKGIAYIESDHYESAKIALKDDPQIRGFSEEEDEE